MTLAVGQTATNPVVAAANAWLGVPYLWGGITRAGVDCSGLVQQVYGALGVALPRTSEAQASAGTPVAFADIRPGDAIFFNNNSHVGIYVGNGQMIDAPHTGTTVGTRPIAGYGPVSAVRRYTPATASTTPAPSSGTGSTGPLDFNDLEALWIQAGGPQVWAPVMAGVALAESGGNPVATNSTDPSGGSFGLWQINGVHDPTGTASPTWVTQMKDPASNAAAAVALWKDQGLSPWRGDKIASVFAGVSAPPSEQAVLSALTQKGIDTNLSGTPAVDAGSLGNTALSWAQDVAKNSVAQKIAQGVDAAVSAATASDQVLGNLVSLSAKLGDPHFWHRIFLGAAGLALITGGAIIFITSTEPGQEAIGTAAVAAVAA